MGAIAGPLRAAARRAGIRRSHLAAARMQAEREVLALIAARHSASHGRILCYHSVGTPAWGVNDVGPDRFRSQLELALRSGHCFVPASAIAGGKGSSNDVAVTFDDGVMSAATVAAPILAEYGIPWTLFVVTDWADGRHGLGDGVLMGWTEVERLAGRGVEIGSHSVSHPDFGLLGADLATHELVESRQVIEARVGIRPEAFAIPMGQSGNWTPGAQAAARGAGYKDVYAQSVIRRPAGTIPRTFITRFDDRRLFGAALSGAFDGWEEWI